MAIAPSDAGHMRGIASPEEHDTSAAWFRHALAGGLETQTTDEILDALFRLAASSGTIDFGLGDKGVTLVAAQRSVLSDESIPRAKTKLRVICARLAVRCGEWAKREVSIYGDIIEVAPPTVQAPLKVRFENTT